MQRPSISRRGALGLVGGALAMPGLAAAAEGLDQLTGSAFGTTWRIAGPAGHDLARLRPAIVALFVEIDRQMSPWRQDSALSRFNASGAGVQPVGPEMQRVAGAALTLAENSEGAFDPTVGPLVARWGFGPIEGGRASGWRGLSLAAGALGKRDPSLTLDLCGIAKGRALDRAAALAGESGHESLLLDLGGELMALGRHPRRRDWRVAIEHPVRDAPPPAVLHLPAGMAVATSGSRAQSYRAGGRIWSHIIDPTSASPVFGELRSVTVLDADAMRADGWATALFAAGDVAGPDLARARGIAALFLYEDGSGLGRVETGGIGALLTEQG